MTPTTSSQKPSAKTTIKSPIKLEETKPSMTLSPISFKPPKTNIEFERDWKACRQRGLDTLYQYFQVHTACSRRMGYTENGILLYSSAFLLPVMNHFFAHHSSLINLSKWLIFWRHVIRSTCMFGYHWTLLTWLLSGINPNKIFAVFWKAWPRFDGLTCLSCFWIENINQVCHALL